MIGDNVQVLKVVMELAFDHAEKMLTFQILKIPTINAGKVVVGGGSDKTTNFMEPTVVSGVKLDDSLMKVLEDKPPQTHIQTH